MDSGPKDLPNDHILHPTPAIVIAVGDYAAQITHQAMTIHLRGDPRRRAASVFYELAPDEETGWTLVELSGRVYAQHEPGVESYLDQRREALQQAISHGKELKNRLETVLHEQRVHDRLIEAGWANEYNVPLNVFVVADVNDPWAAGVLLPFGALLNEAIASTTWCYGHWLLDTAVFPASPADRDRAIWSFLAALDDFLMPESTCRESLAAALGLRHRNMPNFAVYLVDTHKAGTAVVEDDEELDTLTGNALLALLDGELANRFSQERDPDSVFERHGFYSGIGAATLIYAPDSLQAACAQRIAHQFITETILSSARDGNAAINQAHIIEDKLGDLYTWLSAAATGLEAPLGPVEVSPETLTLSLTLKDFKLTAMDLEDIRSTKWPSLLERYVAQFQESTLPEAKQTLADNTTELQTRLKKALAEATEALPLKASLYPGGLDNARQTLELSVAQLRSTMRSIEDYKAQSRAQQTEGKTNLETCVREMRQLIDGAPRIPSLLLKLPGSIRKWLIPIYVTVEYGPELVQLRTLRDKSIGLLTGICAAYLKHAALQTITDIPQQLQDQLQQAQDDLAALRSTFEEACGDLSADWPTFPLGAEENGWHRLFREPVADVSVAEWAYERYHPDLISWLPQLARTQLMKPHWRTVSSEALAVWVLDQGLEAYEDVWRLDVERVFALLAAAAPESRPSDSVSTAMAVSTPPVRPDFDAIGGSTGALTTFHALVGNVKWQYCRVPDKANGAKRWESITTSDRYAATFVQTSRNFPLRALTDSFEDTWRELDSLAQDERQAYDLLAPLEGAKPPPPDPIDPGDPDAVHKSFRWRFRPRGSGEEVEQEIQLTLSQSRYAYYRQEPRLTERWNRYAEIEMPEVRQLAMAFQTLHAEHEWGTRNQASNVLKFVQTCIPYARDKETTGHTEWPRYPIETLIEETGDCEDVAILCAAIIARLGFRVVLLDYPGHVAFGVAGADGLQGDYVLDPRSNLRFFYGEATADGWHLGEIPKRYTSQPPEDILPVTILIEED